MLWGVLHTYIAYWITYNILTAQIQISFHLRQPGSFFLLVYYVKAVVWYSVFIDHFNITAQCLSSRLDIDMIDILVSNIQ